MCTGKSYSYNHAQFMPPDLASERFLFLPDISKVNLFPTIFCDLPFYSCFSHKSWTFEVQNVEPNGGDNSRWAALISRPEKQLNCFY